VLAVAAAAFGCSGKSESNESSSGDAGAPSNTGGAGSATGGTGGATGGTGSTTGGTGGTTGGAGSATGGTAGASGSGGGYVPDDPNVPPEGDGRVSESFEEAPGFGWDACLSKHPGLTLVTDSSGGRASAGAHYMMFDSTLACEGVCQSDGADAQFSFWLDAPLPAGVPLHLYFDAINLGEAAPAGTLQLDQLDFSCATTAPLATIELDELALTSGWQTRCVTLVPQTEVDVFGVYISGEAFHVGLDALRFGPPCHAP